MWKCLYLARNVAKGNNVLSQMTIMNLPSICPVLPLTIETAANKAELPLVARALLTAVQLYCQPGRCLASGSNPLTLALGPEP